MTERTTNRIRQAAAITAALAIATFCYWSWPREPNVGGCATVDEHAELIATACDAPTAVYRLARHTRTTHGCPSGDYLAVPRRGGRHHSGSLGCYTLSVHAGDCLNGHGTTIRRVPCTTAADLRVDAVLTDEHDKHTCPDPPRSVTYSDPTTTICLSKP
ncbi:hypothetical protein [Umezawaea sp. Da 62-37]|uniref:LppU/SCO3897 family protein n=1 Tax=Umezawaea sp. Da 62-37 TaxID=3075927 RepID=UPI0028F71DDD|nr:hypothetical protein [Umezawaea sp. Da 62-37]WNV90900.1 hypothetical protein RM788_22255 [Umezawaea sp. Da 62-37]